MNRYHILTAIEALDSMKYELHAKVERQKGFAGFHNAQHRELCLHREQEVAEALEAFKKELESPAPEKQDHLGKKAPFIVLDNAPITTPVEAPAHRLSDDTANHIREALGLYVNALRKSAANAEELLQFLPGDKKLIQARLEAFRLNEQARQDLNEFNAVYPEEK